MALRTFPAGEMPRVILERINGDVRIEAWEGLTIQLDCDAEPRELYQEGDTLMIEGYDDDLRLRVPASTSVTLSRIDGDLEISGIRRVELAAVAGDVELEQIGEAVTIERLEGDLEAREMPLLQAGGPIQGDAELRGVQIIELAVVEGDLEARGAHTVALERVSGDLELAGPLEQVRCGSIGGDAELVGSERSELSLGNIGGDLELGGAARVRIGNVGGDAELREVSGEVELGTLGGDLEAHNVGALRAANLGGDATVQGGRGNFDLGNVGGDLSLEADLAPGSAVRANVGGDATMHLPAEPNLTLRAMVGGRVSGASISSDGGNIIQLVYGEGAARCELQVGGDLLLRGPGRPATASSEWGEFGREWSEFGREMGAFGREMGREMSELGRELGRLGQELGREIAAAVREASGERGVAWAEEMARKVEEKARRAAERAEAQARQAEERVRSAEERARGGAGRIRVQINDREWRLDPERLEKIKEQARKAASEGLVGAIEAVERALSRIRAESPAASEPPAPPAPPAAPAPATGQTIKIEVSRPPEPAADAEPAVPPAAPDREQEREAILRLIAEGRISPEEGDLLLEALGRQN